MTWQNILANLISTLIWALLVYAVLRVRKQFKADSAIRQQQSDDLAKIFSQSDAAFEKARPHFILMAESVLTLRRTVLMEQYFLTIIGLICLVSQVITLELSSSKLWIAIMTVFGFFSVLLTAYYTAKSSLALGLYERTMVEGLKKLASEKLASLRNGA
jgi:hypothetical protein